MDNGDIQIVGVLGSPVVKAGGELPITGLPDTARPRKPLILGLGHPLRQDDGLGLHILNRLEDICSPFADCLAAGQELLGWLDHLLYRERIIVLDAIDSGYPAGTVLRLYGSADHLLRTLLIEETHSHSSNLGLALALLKYKGSPPTVLIYGIQPEDVSLGGKLTPCVTQAASFLVKQFLYDRPWHHLYLPDAVWLTSDQVIHERTR